MWWRGVERRGSLRAPSFRWGVYSGGEPRARVLPMTHHPTVDDLPTIRVTTDVPLCFGDVVPAGEYRVDHLAPWGPVLALADFRSTLGHAVCVPWRAVGGRVAALEALSEGLARVDALDRAADLTGTHRPRL